MTSVCSVDGCGRPVVGSRVADDLCAAHLQRLRQWGDTRPDVPIRPRRQWVPSRPWSRRTSAKGTVSVLCECGSWVRLTDAGLMAAHGLPAWQHPVGRHGGRLQSVAEFCQYSRKMPEEPRDLSGSDARE